MKTWTSVELTREAAVVESLKNDLNAAVLCQRDLGVQQHKNNNTTHQQKGTFTQRKIDESAEETKMKVWSDKCLVCWWHRWAGDSFGLSFLLAGDTYVQHYHEFFFVRATNTSVKFSFLSRVSLADIFALQVKIFRYYSGWTREFSCSGWTSVAIGLDFTRSAYLTPLTFIWDRMLTCSNFLWYAPPL